MVTNNFGNRNFVQPMRRLNMHSNFFLLSLGVGGEEGGGGFFFNFPLFLTCSLEVPIRFPLCSPRVFPIAPCFNPTRFAQSPPLLTYIGGPKGEALHFSIGSSILRSLDSFNFFCDGPIKLAHCKKNKKLDL